MTLKSSHHIKSPPGRQDLSVSVEEAGWRFLDFAVHSLGAGESTESPTPGEKLLWSCSTVRSGRGQGVPVSKWSAPMSFPSRRIYCT